MAQPPMRVSATTIGAPDPGVLSAFYAKLLGWTVVENEPEWVMVRPPGGGTGLSFQRERYFVPPVWPAEPGKQQMTAHLDIAVDDLESAVAWAVESGARPAEFQPQDDVRVMLDPVGNPFCLFTGDV